MKIEKISQAAIDQLLTEDGQDKASVLLETLRSGKSPTPRSPLFKGEDESVVFKNWLKILDRYSQNYPELVEYDKSRMSKTGRQGGYPPLSERMEELQAYYSNPGLFDLPDNKYFDLVQRTRSLLFRGVKDKRPLAIASVLKRDIQEDKINTNSGAPDVGKRSDPFIQQKAVKDAISGKWREYPALLGSRSSRGSWRFIFMFPFSVNLIEKSFLLPLMDIIRNNNVLSFSAWEGFEEVEYAMHDQKLFESETILSLDYTKMDTSVGISATEFVWHVCAPVFQEQYRNLLLEVMMHCNQINVMIQLNELVVGNHGMASGSGFTNFVESVLSQAVRLLVSDICDEDLQGDQGLGDDGVLSFATARNDVADCFAEASTAFGLEANPDKQRVDSTTCTYLQRFFTKRVYIEGTKVVAGCYPSILALNAAMNPERFHDPRKWSERMEILRWIMILENCNHAPYFKDLVDYFIKGDKYKLGLIIPGFLDKGIESVYEEAKTIKGFVPSYNQASAKRGINEFLVVKYLRTLQSNYSSVGNRIDET